MPALTIKRIAYYSQLLVLSCVDQDMRACELTQEMR